MSTNVHLVRWRHHAHSIHEYKYTTGMCVLQTTDEVDIGGHYNSILEQGQCFVLTVLTLLQTAPERMSKFQRRPFSTSHWPKRGAVPTHVHWPPTVSHTTWVQVKGTISSFVREGWRTEVILVHPLRQQLPT